MTKTAHSASERLLHLVQQRGLVKKAEVAQFLDVSRMTAHRRLHELVQRGVLKATGRGAAAAYCLAGARVVVHPAADHLSLDEHEIAKRLEPALRSLFELNVADAAAVNYGLTEMLNNAIDHAGARAVSIDVNRRGPVLEIVVADNGAGVFAKLRKQLRLPKGVQGERDALLQLEKGKLTTMPERHSGQGIFFTSKIAQRFSLLSGQLQWVVDNVNDVRTVDVHAKQHIGTRVVLEFRPGQIPPYETIFAAYSTGDDNRFAKTRVTVRLADSGGALMSRSEAKRVVAGLEQFEHVTLDFVGVTHVGQGFVDELFRVFARAHPRVALAPVHMSDDVAFMVGRGGAASAPRLATPARQQPTISEAFFRMGPVPMLQARSQLQRAQVDDPQTRRRMSAAALFIVLGLSNASATKTIAARLKTCVGHRRATELAIALTRPRTRPRVGIAGDAEHDVSRLMFADVDNVMRHIAATPELWRHFLSHDALRGFWAKNASARRKLWATGAP